MAISGFRHSCEMVRSMPSISKAKSVSRLLGWLSIALAVAILFANVREVHGGASLTVHAGQSRMMRLSQPVDRVRRRSAVADVQWFHPSAVRCSAKAPATSGAALASDGGLVGQWQVAVTLDWSQCGRLCQETGTSATSGSVNGAEAGIDRRVAVDGSR